MCTSNDLYKDLKIDCEKCFGFCCVALYFSKSEGFPTNKDAGKSCINLQKDFSCSIHNNLREQGLKGCTAYDCFGAGQKVAQVTYKGESWINSPQLSQQMFDVFLVMRQIHEMLWYLTEAYNIEVAYSIREEISLMIKETENITNMSPNNLLKLDVTTHRFKVNQLLKKASELIAQKYKPKNNQKTSTNIDFIGKNLKKINLIGADLKGAFLIAADLRENNLTAANLIGADMRDADIRGANLENSVFITQSQINAAKGDSNTKLPKTIVRPTYWNK
ncbi:pentapeptide repeat-containing protein [Romboutsia sp.]|uniref:pentapeptide repeat-containing protein n=1 Tax=Romboutsia sp. TaxID=1965302 RepID=UPI003F2C24BB